MYILSSDRKSLGEYQKIEVQKNIGGGRTYKFILSGTGSRNGMDTTVLGFFTTEEAAMKELDNITKAMISGAAVYCVMEEGE